MRALLLAALLACVAPHAPAQRGGLVDRIVAVVNKEMNRDRKSVV